METQNFKDLFCARYKCVPDDFESAVLERCLCPKGRSLARVVLRVNPGHFMPDRELIRQAGETTSLDELKSELIGFFNAHPPSGWLRKRMKVRLSGQSLTNLAGKLFEEPAAVSWPGSTATTARRRVPESAGARA